MPCNAVATVKATVAQETLRRLLLTDEASNLIEGWLNRRYGRTTRIAHNHWMISDAQVWMTRGGEIYCTARDRKLAQKVSNEFTEFCNAMANALYAAKVKAALASRYAVTGEQQVGNATVLTLEV